MLQLAIDHDDDGITFDKHGPDRLGNFFPSGGSLSSGASYLHGKSDESTPESMSQHNVANPDKLKLVNYNRKICITEIF